MPGDMNNPVDGKTLIMFGKLQAEGEVAGLTIAEVKALFMNAAPQANLPANAVAEISTMDTEDPEWQAVSAPEKQKLLMVPTDQGLQMYQTVAKIVPDTYKVRRADVCLIFTDPAAPADPPEAP